MPETTNPTSTKSAFNLLPKEVLIWDGRRIKITGVQNYGTEATITGVEISNRHKFVLHYHTIATPLTVEAR